MYNLALALGIATLAFVLGWLGGNTWIAGFVPGLVAVGVAYFLLARRTGRQLEDIMKRAMAEFDNLKPEKLMAMAQRTRNEKAVREYQASVLQKARTILEEGYALDRWQFLIGAQVHAQLGAIDYLERKWSDARGHLEKSWSRNWLSQTQLAAIDWREDKKPAALARMEKTKGPASKEALFWGVYAWMLLESGDRDKAVRVADEGLKAVPGSGPLKEMVDALRNQKKLKTSVWGDAWYQIFPEHLTPEQERAMAEKYAQQRGQYGPPQPRKGFRPR